MPCSRRDLVDAVRRGSNFQTEWHSDFAKDRISSELDRDLHLPASEGCWIQIAKDQIGVGDRRSGAPDPEARGPGTAPALSGPTLSRPPGSIHASEPPPAPTSARSTTGMRTGNPSTCRPFPLARPPTRNSRMTLGCPSRTRPAFAVVPPISKEMTFKVSGRAPENRTRRSRRQRVRLDRVDRTFGNRPRVADATIRLHH